MPFRSNPANNVPASGGGGGSDPIPNNLAGFPRLGTIPSGEGIKISAGVLATGAVGGNLFPGYVGDGDYFYLPTTNAQVIYYNAAGSILWAKYTYDLENNQDDWVGFFFKGTLLYVVTIDIGTAPDNYSLFTIAQDGTVVELGGSSPPGPTDQFLQQPTWHIASYNGIGSSGITYDNFNDDIIVTAMDLTPDTASFFRMSMTGQITTTILPYDDESMTQYGVPWNTTNGSGVFMASGGIFALKFGTSANLGADVDIRNMQVDPQEDGSNLSAISIDTRTYKPVGYQNDATGVDVIVSVSPTATTQISRAKAVSRVAFNDWAIRMCEYMGFDVGEY